MKNETRTNELAVTGNRRDLERKTEQELNIIWDELQERNRAAGPWGALAMWREREGA